MEVMEVSRISPRITLGEGEVTPRPRQSFEIQ